MTIKNDQGNLETYTFDHLLVSTGRVPNVERLNLPIAGIAADRKRGVTVNASLQTTNPNVYAVGDVCLPYKFTHAADASARIVIRNALFYGRGKWTDLLIPW